MFLIAMFCAGFAGGYLTRKIRRRLLRRRTLKNIDLGALSSYPDGRPAKAPANPEYPVHVHIPEKQWWH